MSTTDAEEAESAAAPAPAPADPPAATKPAASAERFRRWECSRVGIAHLHLVQDARIPEPGPAEVQVRVLCSGVCYTDLMILRNACYKSFPFPIIPGYDWVGTVTRTGAGVTGVSVGDTVAGMTQVGGMAQFLNVTAEQVVPVPAGVDPAEAVTAVLNYSTAYGLVHQAAQGKVQPGASVLIHGVAGGAGTALVDIVKAAGVTSVFGTCSASKMALVRDMGVTPIDYRSEDFVARVRELTNGEGVDVVYDNIGGPYVPRSYAALNRRGRAVYYGFTSGMTGEATGSFMWQAIQMFTRIACYNMACCDGRSAGFFGVAIRKTDNLPAWKADVAKVFELLAARCIHPLVSARVPLDAGADALSFVDSLRQVGKIVLLTDDALCERERAAGRITELNAPAATATAVSEPAPAATAAVAAATH